ncbi:hypothetical protein B0J18DRAFT_453354 [Chaetomium sp. MPI-SDFR-AT-0129]|nr:hypothetical protein B0J18DRAFT_453354 [Chaetomium sp. MPI-SDFR-AT-0129]
MHATIRAFKEKSADTLVASRQRGQKRHGLLISPTMSRPYSVFEAAGAMMYAMEWTGHDSDEDSDSSLKDTDDDDDDDKMLLLPVEGSTTGPLKPGYVLKPPVECFRGFVPDLRRMIKIMLVVDYGFRSDSIRVSGAGVTVPSWSDFMMVSDFLVRIARLWRWQQGVPDDRSWALIARLVGDWVDDDGLRLPVWDVATMIYYYQVHRSVDARGEHLDEACAGFTGYTGVLQEMIDEVPTRGKDRLERKLFLDAHLLIPEFIRDRQLQQEMLLKAQHLAVQYGCQLAPPETRKPPEPPQPPEVPQAPEMLMVPKMLKALKMARSSLWRRVLDKIVPHREPECREVREKVDEKLKDLEWDSD